MASLIDAAPILPSRIIPQKSATLTMAETITIVSLISATFSIIKTAASVGKCFHQLKEKWKAAGRDLHQFSVHVSAVRFAARALSTWLEDDQIDADDVAAVKDEL